MKKDTMKMGVGKSILYMLRTIWNADKGCVIYSLDNVLLKVVFGVVPVCLAVLLIIVCCQRIGEIKKGEEDDLSKY